MMAEIEIIPSACMPLRIRPSLSRSRVMTTPRESHKPPIDRGKNDTRTCRQYVHLD